MYGKKRTSFKLYTNIFLLLQGRISNSHQSLVQTSNVSCLITNHILCWRPVPSLVFT